MGWPILIGQYYSLVLVGVFVGVLYPIYYLYLSTDARNGNVEQNLKRPMTFILFSVFSSFRFGLYSFLLLTILAIIVGVLFSIWAIFNSIGI